MSPSNPLNPSNLLNLPNAPSPLNPSNPPNPLSPLYPPSPSSLSRPPNLCPHPSNPRFKDSLHSNVFLKERDHREKWYSREKPWKRTLKELIFGKVVGFRSANFRKVNSFTDIFDFAKTVSYPAIIIVKNLITTIFKEHLAVDASGGCESWTVIWNVASSRILRTSIFQNTFHLSQLVFR